MSYIKFQRNEEHHCPGCGQANALHPDSTPPGPDCELSKGEHGLDPEHYREDEPRHNAFGEAGYGEGHK